MQKSHLFICSKTRSFPGPMERQGRRHLRSSRRRPLRPCRHRRRHRRPWRPDTFTGRGFRRHRTPSGSTGATRRFRRRHLRTRRVPPFRLEASAARGHHRRFCHHLHRRSCHRCRLGPWMKSSSPRQRGPPMRQLRQRRNGCLAGAKSAGGGRAPFASAGSGTTTSTRQRVHSAASARSKGASAAAPAATRTPPRRTRARRPLRLPSPTPLLVLTRLRRVARLSTAASSRTWCLTSTTLGTCRSVKPSGLMPRRHGSWGRLRSRSFLRRLWRLRRVPTRCRPRRRSCLL